MEKRFYKIDEVAVYLGFSVSTVRKWIRLGSIPFCKINGGIRLDKQEIDKWVTKSKRSIHYV